MKRTLLWLAILFLGSAAAINAQIEPHWLAAVTFNVWGSWILAYPLWRLVVRPFLRGYRG